MIFWTGFGFLVPLIAFGCLLAFEAGLEAYYQDDKYYQTHGWPKLAAFVLAAAIIWLIGAVLDRRPARTLVDLETGEQVRVGAKHTFMFVPLRWWPFVCIALRIAFAFIAE
jgi:hypothetical protein